MALVVLGTAVTIDVTRGARGGHPIPVGSIAPGAVLHPSSTEFGSQLNLQVLASPSAICAGGGATCAAGVGVERVTLTAAVPATVQTVWPAVQVAFVIETTPYDGVFDPSAWEAGRDPCTTTPGYNGTLCEESNGVPFFVANAQTIANAIAAANPRTNVSFALVDYFATLTGYDDYDGAEYHVDLPEFVPATGFGNAVHNTLATTVLNGDYVYPDSDLADNFLDSSSITALFGTLGGSGLDWSNGTHHVIVWMGSTAPRDPGYPVDYCASGSADSPGTYLPCVAPTCEPSYKFPTLKEPQCEGWVQSRDGNPVDSIAGLARSTPSCTDSLGGTCTVDTVDYWDTPTDPYSLGWPASNGSDGRGPGGPKAVGDASSILRAGCDMAIATGGSWAGPAYASCSDGRSGSLVYVPHGPAGQPDTSNPTLLAALRGIGFGPVTQTTGPTAGDVPLFQFVPFGSIVPATPLNALAVCIRGGEAAPTCPSVPSVRLGGSATVLGWNWSADPAANVLQAGDTWSVSFDVVATGPPFALVPLDACTTSACAVAGSQAVDGFATVATFRSAVDGTLVVESFPLAEVDVEPELTVPGTTPTGTPPPPASTSLPATPGSSQGFSIPGIQPGPLAASVGLASVSLSALAAGMLGAGFMRIGLRIRQRAIAVATATAVRRPPMRPRPPAARLPVGRFD